jgi:hypothetical protein
MSTIWTPSGEQPVGGGQRGGPGGGDGPPPDREPTEAEMAAHLDELRRELASAPAAVVVANHAMGLFELAALHLSQQPPTLSEASVAIDAMAGIVDRLEGRLGDNEQTLKDALAQLRLAFVQIRASDPDGVPEEPEGER